MKQKLVIACDHAAFKAKEALKAALIPQYDVIDLGTHSEDSVHYPEFAKKLCHEVVTQKTMGILLCGSGIGVSMTANRFKGIRAALCRDHEDAKMARLHNDANVLCLGGRRNSEKEILLISQTFLSTAFEGGRHQTRIDQFDGLGEDA